MTPEELRRIREALGMTGRAMARYLCIHEVHYYHLEGGRHPITDRTARQVLDLAKRRVAECKDQP